MRLWMPKRCTVCHLQAEEQENCWCYSVWIQSPENWGADGIRPDLVLKAQEPGILMSEGRRGWVSQFKQWDRTCLSSTFFFKFGLSTDWMMSTYIVGGGASALLSSQIQMWVSSGNNLTDTPSYLGFHCQLDTYTHHLKPYLISKQNQ